MVCHLAQCHHYCHYLTVLSSQVIIIRSRLKLFSVEVGGDWQSNKGAGILLLSAGDLRMQFIRIWIHTFRGTIPNPLYINYRPITLSPSHIHTHPASKKCHLITLYAVGINLSAGMQLIARRPLKLWIDLDEYFPIDNTNIFGSFLRMHGGGERLVQCSITHLRCGASLETPTRLSEPHLGKTYIHMNKSRPGRQKKKTTTATMSLATDMISWRPFCNLNTITVAEKKPWNLLRAFRSRNSVALRFIPNK